MKTISPANGVIFLRRVETQTESGLIIAEGREKGAKYGEVVAADSTYWNPGGEGRINIEPGNIIVYDSRQTVEMALQNEKYVIIKPEWILARLN